MLYRYITQSPAPIPPSIFKLCLSKPKILVGEDHAQITVCKNILKFSPAKTSRAKNWEQPSDPSFSLQMDPRSIFLIIKYFQDRYLPHCVPNEEIEVEFLHHQNTKSWTKKTQISIARPNPGSTKFHLPAHLTHQNKKKALKWSHLLP